MARSNDAATERKLLRAGANHVISPYAIAGHRIATQLMHPSVVDFLDVVMHSGDEEMWLEEVEVRAGTGLAGKTLVECDLNRSVGVNVLALRRRGTQRNVETGAISDARLEEGDVLVALGTRPTARRTEEGGLVHSTSRPKNWVSRSRSRPSIVPSRLRSAAAE